MQQSFEELIKSPWIGLISLLIGIASLASGLIFFLKSRRRKKPVYYIDHLDIIKKDRGLLEGLKVTMHGVEINNLYKTRIAFWNDGNETINYNDVANTNKLRLELKSLNAIAKIFDYEIFPINLSNNFVLIKDNNTLIIKFEYIGHGDGVVIDVYHNCNRLDELQLKGIIKGVDIIQEEHNFSNNKRNSFYSFQLIASVLALIIWLINLIIIFDIISLVMVFLLVLYFTWVMSEYSKIEIFIKGKGNFKRLLLKKGLWQDFHQKSNY